jgi:pyruvate formate-lyase activating enzyme-like uncharacterized protein
MDFTEKLTGVVRSLKASVAPGIDAEAKAQAKEFDLEFDLSNCTVEDVIELALRPRRITWQNANRYNEKLEELGSTVRIIVKPIGIRETKEVSVESILKRAHKLSAEKRAELAAKLAGLMAENE